MKAILVIDMPKNCDECQFCGRGGRNLERYVCSLTGEHSEDIHLVGCPLKPIPQKIEEWETSTFSSSYEKGWNDCLKEIEDGEC